MLFCIARYKTAVAIEFQSHGQVIVIVVVPSSVAWMRSAHNVSMDANFVGEGKYNYNA